jgi:hypothetical protein
MKKKSRTIIFLLLATLLILALVYYFVDVRDSVTQEDSNPRIAVDVLIDNIEEGNLEYLEEQTKLTDEIAFGDWDEIKTVEVGETRFLKNEEGEKIALIRTDFMFSLNIEEDEVFEYPTTLVFVLEQENGEWIVADIDYGLDRYREAKED